MGQVIPPVAAEATWNIRGKIEPSRGNPGIKQGPEGSEGSETVHAFQAGTNGKGRICKKSTFFFLRGILENHIFRGTQKPLILEFAVLLALQPKRPMPPRSITNEGRAMGSHRLARTPGA
jgi:hypothetical protein